MAELRTERIVAHPLDDGSIIASSFLDHLADAAQMVPVIVVEREFVLAEVADVLRRLAVALVRHVEVIVSHGDVLHLVVCPMIHILFSSFHYNRIKKSVPTIQSCGLYFWNFELDVNSFKARLSPNFIALLKYSNANLSVRSSILPIPLSSYTFFKQL